MIETCSTCRWWTQGSTYTQKAYDHIPERVAWTVVQTGQYKHQQGECRIVAPYRCGGYFPQTYEFQGCGEHQPKEGGHG